MYIWDPCVLPPPQLTPYSYGVDAGLVRTPMDNGYTLQRRRWSNRPALFNIAFAVDGAGLQTVSNVINSECYTWAYLPLISGANGMPKPMDHLVRFVSDITASVAGWDYYKVSGVVELEEATPSCTLVVYCDDYLVCLESTYITPYTVFISQGTWDTIADGWGDSTYWGMANG